MAGGRFSRGDVTEMRPADPSLNNLTSIQIELSAQLLGGNRFALPKGSERRYRAGILVVSDGPSSKTHAARGKVLRPELNTNQRSRDNSDAIRAPVRLRTGGDYHCVDQRVPELVR